MEDAVDTRTMIEDSRHRSFSWEGKLFTDFPGIIYRFHHITILRRLQIVSRQLTTMAAAQKTTVTLNNGEAPCYPLPSLRQQAPA